jgi:hypothetical protein
VVKERKEGYGMVGDGALGMSSDFRMVALRFAVLARKVSSPVARTSISLRLPPISSPSLASRYLLLKPSSSSPAPGPPPVRSAGPLKGASRRSRPRQLLSSFLIYSLQFFLFLIGARCFLGLLSFLPRGCGS